MQERSAQTSNEVPISVTAGSNFSRWPKMSPERTQNMFTADGFSMNFAGYQFRVPLLENGRGFYSSKKANMMFAVSSRVIYRITDGLQPIFIGTIQTDGSDVSIDEDVSGNIAFCDGVAIYIYNYIDNRYYVAGSDVSSVGQVITQLDFVPNYIKFQDGRFVATSASSGGNQVGQWRLSQIKPSDNKRFVVFPSDAQHQGGFQTKPDLPVAATRLPGRANTIYIMGSEVTEPWTDYGTALFPYQRNSTFNLDFGCINPATISELNNLVVWLAGNERSGPFIAYSTGQDIQKISDFGIDSLMEKINSPQTSYGFTFIQSGHLFYVITFYDPRDNISLAYDFNEKKFYNLTDENGNFFIAKKVVYFNGKYYFISIVDGNIYEINPYFTTYNYQPTANDDGIREIPRGCICPTYRTQDSVIKRFNDFYLIVEQGVDPEFDGTGNFVNSITIESGGTGYTTATILIEGDGYGAFATATITSGVITAINLEDKGVGYTWAVATVIGDGSGAQLECNMQISDYVPRVDISVSYDGGYTWSNYAQMELQTLGRYKNRFYFNGLGSGNEITLKYLYNIRGRFVVSDGVMSVY